MHDEAAMPLPDGARNGAFEKRRKHHVRMEQLRRLAGDVVVDVELHRQLVPVGTQLHVQPLRQAVEGVRQHQDAHQPAAAMPRRYWWYAAQAPSADTMQEPMGSRGVQVVPKSAQSVGFLAPRMMALH